MTTITKILYWAARLVAALVLLQTLYFKFGGSEESIYIFSTVGIEPWGRYATGVAELIASVLLLVNRTAWLGALLALGIMAGAIMTHLTILGIEVMEDKGYLFILACIVTLCAAYVAWLNKEKILKLWPF